MPILHLRLLRYLFLSVWPTGKPLKKQYFSGLCPEPHWGTSSAPKPPADNGYTSSLCSEASLMLMHAFRASCGPRTTSYPSSTYAHYLYIKCAYMYVHKTWPKNVSIKCVKTTTHYMCNGVCTVYVLGYRYIKGACFNAHARCIFSSTLKVHISMYIQGVYFNAH